MEKFDSKNIRDVAIVSHAGAGKTSIAESLLFKSGAITRLGSVEAGNTTADYNRDEIDRKISINAKLLNITWKNNRFYIIDTPGYADFVGEVISSLRAVDSAVVIVCGMNGVEVGTDRVWQFLDELHLPRLIFINKLDKENSDFYRTLQNIQDRFGKRCVAIELPVGEESTFSDTISLFSNEKILTLSEADKKNADNLREKLIEIIAESDDKLLEKYLDSGNLSPEEIQAGFRKAVLSGKLIPVLCGSAIKEIGTKQLLDVIADLLPSASDIKPIEGTSPNTNNKEVRNTTDNDPLSAFVFKSILDPYVGQLTLFRIFSGQLQSDTGFFNASKKSKERIGQLYIMQGKEQKAIASAHAGDIVAVAKLKDTTTGDTLSDEKNPIVFNGFIFPEPAISVSVKPKSRSDEDKISGALSKLTNEDPTFKVARDTQTKELIASGVGDLHLDIMIKRLKEKFGVEVDIGMPKVAYKETITKKIQMQGKYKRQSGGRGQYGDVWLELEPLPRGTNFEFVDKVVGGVVPRNYIPSVEKGVVAAMQEGMLAGYPIVDVRVTIYDGSYHPVDSSDMAFQIAGSMAFKKGCLEANPVLLEPIMNVEIVVPEEFMGSITGDINSRRGRIMGMDASSSKTQVVKAQVPLAELLKYATELRSMTGGRGSYSMRFSHYDIVPQKILQAIISQYQKSKETKEEV